MLRAAADFVEIFACTRRQVGVLERDAVKSNDGVHRRSNLMTHGTEERCLGGVCLFRLRQRIAKGATLRHCLTRFRVHVRKSDSHCAYDGILTLIRHTNIGDPKHFVLLLPVNDRHVAVRNHSRLFQSPADVFRRNKIKESRTILLSHFFISIVSQRLKIGKRLAHPDSVHVFPVGAVADTLVFFQIDVVHDTVVRGHGGNHRVRLPFLTLLLQQLVLKR